MAKTGRKRKADHIKDGTTPQPTHLIGKDYEYHKEYMREYMRKWRAANRDKQNLHAKQYKLRQQEARVLAKAQGVSERVDETKETE